MFVQHPGKAGYRASEIPGSVAGVLEKGLGTPHIWSEIGVEGEHVLVLGGCGTLQGKLEGEGLPPCVQPLLVKLDAVVIYCSILSDIVRY